MKIVHLCSTQDDSWSWLGGQTHRRGACTRACNRKVRIDYPHTEYGEFKDLFLADVPNVVMKVYNLCRVSNYSNSRVRGYGQLEWPYCSPVRLFKMTCEMN